MSVLLDEDTIVLEGLDFDVPCKTRQCENAATWALQARCCDHSTLKCNDCLEAWRLEVTAKLGRPVVCGQCGRRQTLSFDCYRVVPL